ncbi:class I SAM-dependent methyltransferase [Gracilibacillus caseinilyticus]|uniref:Class I SAM-dependent methyltransferase n=1 Tax=Gracilibacillus caseinilyticus TaxID=2932256 RepID=A0ABY4EV24_9BACI|nr:class I SAM-dependent methyltransferase [Gracilibacillus caseinilyticus]UOQ47697.1 class I SAM-dependent methyltransferase [Gracilibacillus caseinilyticus]
MIITTAGRTTDIFIREAQVLAEQYHFPYVERKGVSVEQLKKRYHTDVLVVGKNRLNLSPQELQTDVFFHPNMAMVRAKRLLKGEGDPFIQATGLRSGMSYLDCTLGLASDAIIASIAVGPSGVVTGVEGSFPLYLLVKEGLQHYQSANAAINTAMKQIEVKHAMHLQFLQHTETNAYDVIYFDPMFEERIDTSDGIKGLRSRSITEAITEHTIAEAKRVARKRVVLKDHYKSKRFAEFGFEQQIRKTALFHYGVIDVY